MRCTVFFIITFVFCCSSPKGIEVKYKAFDSAVYSLNYSSDKKHSSEKTVTLVTTMSNSGEKSNSLNLQVKKFTTYWEDEPPKDELYSDFSFSNAGFDQLWAIKNRLLNFGIPAVGARKVITGISPFLLPYFSKSRLEPGETFPVKTAVPISFSNDVNKNYGKRITVTQQFTGLEEMLGFDCVKIRYSSADTLYTQKGKALVCKIDGLIHFAVKEGIVVSDIGTFEIDILAKNAKSDRLVIYKKLRLLHFTP